MQTLNHVESATFYVTKRSWSHATTTALPAICRGIVQASR